jgi:hypothetical protein
MGREWQPKKVVGILAGNDLAARIILADPVKYAGLPLIWAQLWTSQQKEAYGRTGIRIGATLFQTG